MEELAREKLAKTDMRFLTPRGDYNKKCDLCGKDKVTLVVQTSNKTLINFCKACQNWIEQGE